MDAQQNFETQFSICQWTTQTFGEAGSDLRCATRANEEMAECLKALATPDFQAARVEVADTVIVLMRLAMRLGYSADFLFGAPPVQSSGLTPLQAGTEASLALSKCMVALNTRGYRSAVSTLADALFSLRELAWALGTTLGREVDSKMAINRAREWKLDGTGHGYHVKYARREPHLLPECPECARRFDEMMRRPVKRAPAEMTQQLRFKMAEALERLSMSSPRPTHEANGYGSGMQSHEKSVQLFDELARLGVRVELDS